MGQLLVSFFSDEHLFLFGLIKVTLYDLVDILRKFVPQDLICLHFCGQFKFPLTKLSHVVESLAGPAQIYIISEQIGSRCFIDLRGSQSNSLPNFSRVETVGDHDWFIELVVFFRLLFEHQEKGLSEVEKVPLAGLFDRPHILHALQNYGQRLGARMKWRLVVVERFSGEFGA